MKVIFLDIDGVLNAAHNYVKNWKTQEDWLVFTKQHQRKAEELGISMAFHMPVQYAIGWLNQLIEDTGAKVVITSTWRGRGVEYMQKVLDFEGVVCEVIGETCNDEHWKTEDFIPSERMERIDEKDYDGYCRGDQIKDWLLQHPDVENYVILDDDSDMLKEQKHHFVNVNNEHGFTRLDYVVAKNILK